MTEETKQILAEQGYSSLNEYFRDLSEDYGVSLRVVKTMHSVLGDSELFDGLPCALSDMGE